MTKIKVDRKPQKRLEFVLDYDGYWVCPHKHTHIDASFGCHRSGDDYEDDGAEVCDQCGAYRWLEGDDSDWHEDEDSQLAIFGTMKGGARND